ncbi:hypothetical protein MOF49_02305 [Bacillus haynesii]|nr:hypothetical protein [Bacillus haynesii]
MKRSFGTFEIDGLTIEYSRVGERKAILVMHGGHSNCCEEFGYQEALAHRADDWGPAQITSRSGNL